MKRIQYRINFFDFDELNKLLNIFGLSLKIENGCCFFIDIETGLQLVPYIYHAEHGSMKIYTDDAKTLLNRYPFYLETRTKFYELNIAAGEDIFCVYKIFKKEKVKPDLVEEANLEATYSVWAIKESTYNYDEASCPRMTNINEVVYSANEIIYPNLGLICVKSPDFSKYAELLYFKKNKNSEIHLDETVSARHSNISVEEATFLIEQSRVFKDVMELFSPKTLEGYINSKSTALTRKIKKTQ